MFLGFRVSGKWCIFVIASSATKDGGARESAHGRAVNGSNYKNTPFAAGSELHELPVNINHLSQKMCHVSN